jgi:hypothetical protein
MLAACGGNAIDEGNLKPVPPSSMFIERPIAFCGESASDKFTIGYFGTRPQDSSIFVHVICHQRDTVFQEAYPGEWFLDSPAPASDSDRVQAIQSKMRALADGKLTPAIDDADALAAGEQAIIGWELPGHVRRLMYFSPADHKVHALD